MNFSNLFASSNILLWICLCCCTIAKPINNNESSDFFVKIKGDNVHLDEKNETLSIFVTGSSIWEGPLIFPEVNSIKIVALAPLLITGVGHQLKCPESVEFYNVIFDGTGNNEKNLFIDEIKSKKVVFDRCTFNNFAVPLLFKVVGCESYKITNNIFYNLERLTLITSSNTFSFFDNVTMSDNVGINSRLNIYRYDADTKQTFFQPDDSEEIIIEIE